MSETERQRRLSAITEILSKPEVPGHLRKDLENAREDLSACVIAQGHVAQSWRREAFQAARRGNA